MKRHWLIIFSVLCAVLLFSQRTIAQEIPVPKTEKSKQVKISKVAEDLSVSLDENLGIQ